MSNDPDATVLEVTDLVTRFSSERGTVNAVRGVSLSLERGRTLGVVGESGSGKSVLSRSPCSPRWASPSRPDACASTPTRCRAACVSAS